MQKYYSNLIILESNQKEGVFCKGRGWLINFESNPSSRVVTSGEPAKEIVVYTQSADRAQHVVDMVLAAYCLYTGELLTFDSIPIFQTIGSHFKSVGFFNSRNCHGNGDGHFNYVIILKIRF